MKKIYFNTMKDISEFEEKMGIKFNDHNLLKQAFTHRSYLNENPKWELGHNERLEFLGDAVLELVVSSYLFKNFPKEQEGYLTSLRAALVNTYTISSVADDMGFEDYLIMSKGETKDNGRGRTYILANTFEGFLGALYLDQGYEKSESFILKNLIQTRLEEIIKNKAFKDSKSLFQEKAQAILGITPLYKVAKEWGPDHDKNFKMAVYLGKELIAEGKGASKQEAETEAAQKALDEKGW